MAQPSKERYFDPQALLSEDTLIPTTFRYPVKSLGKALDPTCSSSDLPADHALDLPLWMVAPLQERNIVDANLPGAYSERNRRRADAGASCVNLKGTPYYYDVGLRCSGMLDPEGGQELSRFLRATFAERYQGMLSGSLRALDGAVLQHVLGKLNEEERQLYQAGRVGAARQEQWWAAGGRTAMLMAPLRQQQQQQHAGKRQRVTEAARDKENAR
ncbi:hypothetical protein Rsub_11628 [Raphidocelis subcapitata]|uniref:DNA replication complex GINS protein PSF3 n=1 Tax=Raphidocelis subcapitata TaxID=307507 RepID=A0A2V0PM79_9CHLO|nr:hypothetical protein Rsub_11628 [Raphidocelis subcapitata]|eukprot:GBF99183.1 hypothetical protein Rsub_11628 [Raphidocelis subcapitata]